MSEASRPKLPRQTVSPGRSDSGDENSGADRSVDRIDVSRYIAEICSEMTTMANAAQLGMLTYLLGMARDEADRIARLTHLRN